LPEVVVVSLLGEDNVEGLEIEVQPSMRMNELDACEKIFRYLSRVARFFLVQHTKMGENIINDLKIYRMATKYTKWL
jgi:hypothetical protein